MAKITLRQCAYLVAVAETGGIARGTELTPQGRAFLPAAYALLQQAEMTEHQAMAVSAERAGVIRLGCFHTIAPFYLPRMISAYREQYPDVHIDACELQQDEIVAGINTGKLDLAVTYDMSLDHRAVISKTLTRLKPVLLLNG